METVTVLQVNIASVDHTKILHQVERWLAQPEPQKRVIFYANAHCLNIAQADAAYKTILSEADLVYPDGISVVWASHLLARPTEMKKTTGADWIGEFCALAVKQNWRLYLLGSRPAVIKGARVNLQAGWPGLNIVGAYDGYFTEKSEPEIIQDIKAVKPHVLFVGMGTPHQEKWIARHQHHLPVSIYWAVGALFDYVGGVEKRVPPWLNGLALEWLWRLLLDPGGKWRRYLLGNPLFVMRVLRQMITQILK